MADDAPSGRTLNDRVRDVALIERALVRAVREALRRHKQAGNPIGVWQDGRVVLIQPEDIPDFSEADHDPATGYSQPK